MSRDKSQLVNYAETTFSSRFKETFRDISNKKIAKLLKVSEPAVSSYVNGRIPPPDKLIEISRITGCNLHWLLTGEGEKLFSRTEKKKTQMLIFQCCKGGVGTSNASALTAFTLARRGFRVLVLSNESGHAAGMVLTSFGKEFTFDWEDKLKVPNANVYANSWLPKLDTLLTKENMMSFRKNIKFNPLPKNILSFFDKYDFIIMDAQTNQYPYALERYYNKDVISALDTYLYYAKLIIPYQPSNSIVSNVRHTLGYFISEQMKYPESKLLGVFLNIVYDQTSPDKYLNIKSKIKEINDFARTKMMKSVISHQPDEIEEFLMNSEDFFGRKMKLIDEFESLVDEIISRL